jgi:AcrR family transcriptional regulator
MGAVPASAGLRERKKQQTRELIADTARRLFAERGFDTVTVAEVARSANVSEVTVFNYFPTKDDLLFGGMQFFEEQLIDAVRSRPEGESVLATFRRTVIDGTKRLGSEETTDAIVAAGNLILASTSLAEHEREVVSRYTALLAVVLAEEADVDPGDVETVGVAAALMGVQRALVGYVRSNVMAGRRGPRLAADARSQALRAFGRLERGLMDYGTKEGRGVTPRPVKT